jgi:hypothetical protein
VLTVAGLLAMLVPSGDNIGLSAEAPPPQTIEIPPAPQTADLAQNSGTDEVEESEMSDDDVFAIGEGAIDGNPSQGSFGNSAEAPPPMNYDPSSMPGYAQPGMNNGFSAPQPAGPSSNNG